VQWREEEMASKVERRVTLGRKGGREGGRASENRVREEKQYSGGKRKEHRSWRGGWPREGGREGGRERAGGWRRTREGGREGEREETYLHVHLAQRA